MWRVFFNRRPCLSFGSRRWKVDDIMSKTTSAANALGSIRVLDRSDLYTNRSIAHVAKLLLESTPPVLPLRPPCKHHLANRRRRRTLFIRRPRPHTLRRLILPHQRRPSTSNLERLGCLHRPEGLMPRGRTSGNLERGRGRRLRASVEFILNLDGEGAKERHIGVYRPVARGAQCKKDRQQTQQEAAAKKSNSACASPNEAPPICPEHQTPPLYSPPNTPGPLCIPTHILHARLCSPRPSLSLINASAGIPFSHVPARALALDFRC